MYNPSVFKSEDSEAALNLMKGFPFATVISTKENKPIISHLPLVANKLENSFVLTGHMARANSQWHTFQDSEVTVVFTGPHAYITPKWYIDSENEVPTWNYSVVHARGSVEIIEDFEGAVECLKSLSAHAEKLWPSGWKFSVPEYFMGDTLMKNIVAFKIKVVDMDFKMKLSQNRIREDRVSIAKGLAEKTDDRFYELLNSMLDLYLTEDNKFL